MMVPADVQMLTAEQAAELMNVSRSTIFRMHKEDPDFGVRLRKRIVRFPRHQVEAKAKTQFEDAVKLTLANTRRNRRYQPSGIDHLAD